MQTDVRNSTVQALLFGRGIARVGLCQPIVEVFKACRQPIRVVGYLESGNVDVIVEVEIELRLVGSVNEHQILAFACALERRHPSGLGASYAVSLDSVGRSIEEGVHSVRHEIGDVDDAALVDRKRLQSLFDFFKLSQVFVPVFASARLRRLRSLR